MIRITSLWKSESIFNPEYFKYLKYFNSEFISLAKDDFLIKL